MNCGTPVSEKSKPKIAAVILLCAAAALAILLLTGVVLYVTGVFEDLFDSGSDWLSSSSTYDEDQQPDDEEDEEALTEPEPGPTTAPTQAPVVTEAPTQAPAEDPSQAPTQAPTEAPTQAATEAPIIEAEARIVSVYGSSALSEDGMTHCADRLLDGDTATGWAEGASGNGEGESVTFIFDGTYPFTGFDIWAGYHKSDRLYRANARPSLITVTASDGYCQQFPLTDSMAVQTVSFNKPVAASWITITVDGVYPGDTFSDLVISEIQFH